MLKFDYTFFATFTYNKISIGFSCIKEVNVIIHISKKYIPSNIFQPFIFTT